MLHNSVHPQNKLLRPRWSENLFLASLTLPFISLATPKFIFDPCFKITSLLTKEVHSCFICLVCGHINPQAFCAVRCFTVAEFTCFSCLYERISKVKKFPLRHLIETWRGYDLLQDEHSWLLVLYSQLFDSAFRLQQKGGLLYLFFFVTALIMFRSSGNTFFSLLYWARS